MPSEKQIEAAMDATHGNIPVMLLVRALTAAEQAEPAPSGYYYPIPMPLDADGKGPASFEEGEVRKLVFEVWDQDFHSHGTFDNLPEAIAHANRLNAPAARSGAVKVKALEWKDERNCECSAETIIGTYEVGFDDGWWAQLEGGSTWDWQPEQDPRSYYGPSAAKAAAQADYERRILAALEPAEPATDVEPFTYFYRYSDPMSGKAVWRSSGGLWNGQHPSETLPLFTRPPESRLREALESIANNTCCSGCQEAALVARAALAQEDGR